MIRRTVFCAVFVVLVCSAVIVFWRSCLYIEKSGCAVTLNRTSRVVTGFYTAGMHWTGFCSIFSPSAVLRNHISGTVSCELSAVIPGAPSDDPVFHVKLPVEIRYHVGPSFLPQYADCDGDFISRYFERTGTVLFRDALSRHVNDTAGADAAVAAAVSEVVTQMKPVAFENGFVSVESISHAASYPDTSRLASLQAHSGDKFRLMLAQELKALESEGDIRRMKSYDDYYAARLERISKIVATNPAILKYIYIDKLGGNVKMILSSGSEGYPFGLESERTQTNGHDDRQIDNLK